MENVEIAAVLEEVAAALEVQGANPFRIRAYRNGARTVRNHTRPLAEMVEAGEDLRELPGIGEDLSRYITELVTTGSLRLLGDVEREVPAPVLELMHLEGVGPKRARVLHEQLGVTSLTDLERALDRGEVETLRGFGRKTAERLRQAVRDRRQHVARLNLADADQLVRPLLEYMGRAPGLERLEPAGSYRRRRETVGDVDLLAIARKAGPVMEHFVHYPEARRVESAGSTRGTLVLRGGLHVDLRILPPESYGAALHYFTGSKAHNIAVRRLGVERGLRISEYGVFRVDHTKGNGKGVRIGGKREGDVFAAVGMEWVPPELREDRGEVAAALEGRLPELVTLGDIRGDLQMHSTWSDGHDSIRAMAEACRELGYAYMAVTDHSQAVRVAGGLAPKELQEQWAEIDRVREEAPGIRVFRGMEVDILPDGSLDLPTDLLAGLDVVVVSIHSGFRMGKPRMTERMIRGISTPGVHVLAHPTGRILGRRMPYAVDMEAVLEAAADVGVAVEINAQPDRLDLDDVLARRAKELGVKVVVNTDAHGTDNLAYMRYGVDQARRAWLEKGDVLNTMPLSRIERWLAARRPTASAGMIPVRS